MIPLFFESDILQNDKKFNGIDLKHNKYCYDKNDVVSNFLPDKIQRTYIDVNNFGNSNYYYPIYWHCHMTFSNNLKFKNNVKFNIPEKVLLDIRSNRSKILLVNGYEGFSLDQYDTVIYDFFIKPYGLDYSNFVTLTGNLINKSKKGVDNVYYNFWENIVEFHEREQHNLIEHSINNICSNNLRLYKYICLQRRPKLQRLALFTEFYNRTDGILTMGIGDKGNINEVVDLAPQLLSNYPKTYKKYQKEKIINSLPKTYDVNLSIENPTHDLNIEKYLDSYLHIVSETFFENEPIQMFFSEKIYKPIAFLQPFVIFGQTNSLQYLKELGFKTFFPFINEAYDSIEDDVHRFYSALKSIKQFLNQDKIKIHEQMKEMLPILVHNYYTLKERNKYNHIELTSNLLNLLNKKH